VTDSPRRTAVIKEHPIAIAIARAIQKFVATSSRLREVQQVWALDAGYIKTPLIEQKRL
jgi:hypothetical protein